MVDFSNGTIKSVAFDPVSDQSVVAAERGL
jgi:hypothetical protein